MCWSWIFFFFLDKVVSNSCSAIHVKSSEDELDVV